MALAAESLVPENVKRKLMELLIIKFMSNNDIIHIEKFYEATSVHSLPSLSCQLFAAKFMIAMQITCVPQNHPNLNEVC